MEQLLINDFRRSAKALADARVAEAESFLRHRIQKGSTDGQAMRAAVIDTKGQLDIALADYAIAEALMHSALGREFDAYEPDTSDT